MTISTKIKQFTLPLFYLILLSLVPSYAINWNLDVYQWKNVNQTTPYLNEFMICYAENKTHGIHYANYQAGVSELVISELLCGCGHDIKCCDNCHVENGVMMYATNSLKYTLETNVTFDGDEEFNYYVGDISDYLRIGAIVNTEIDSLEGGMDFLLGLGVLLAFIIGIPVLLCMAFPTADINKLIAMGGSIGLVLGLGTTAAYNLFNSGQSVVILIFAVMLLWIIGGLNRG